ncbi:hypothetical protein FOZ60_003857 [Perkinsus olseni]|uniref:Integrase catalytic domain-containing protein n=1 Tax=Perkinsus olseni TaxID=32597 RepID=A0A7J6NWQ6_PEROL|nr:hypothetical protein FOZ60_003857 [Perkinsus olseni]
MDASRYLDITRSAGEAQCRAHCDIARQIAGRCTGNWDDEIDSKEEQQCRKHLQAAEVIWRQLNGAVPLIKNARDLKIVVDASNTGYGIELWVPAGQLSGSVGFASTGWISVYAESKLFPYGCTWHANRRELYGMLIAFIAVIDQMQSEWWNSLKSVEVCNDSLVSIRRMRSSPRKIHGIEQLSISRLRSSIDEAVEELRLLGVNVTFSHHSHNSFYINRVDILSRVAEDLPPSNVLTNICCEVDKSTTREIPTMASDIIDFHYPYSLMIPTINSIPSLCKFMTLDKSFQAWRGRGPTDSSEVIRRFLINQQDRDPQVREAKEVLESSLDPSSFKANLPPSLYHYIQHCVLFNGVLCKVESWDEDEALKIVLPRPAVSSLLNELGSYYHHIRGHVGVDATYRHVRKLFWAPALRKSIKSVVRSCAACLVTTPAKKLRHESHLRCPSAPFEVIGCDLVGPLVPGAIQAGGSSGARWILTATDLLSRYCLLFPLSDISTSSICRVLEREVFLVYRAPSTVITDLGSNLISLSFDALCAYYSCKHLTLPVRHPSSGGFYEVSHLQLARSLRRSLQGRNPSSWPELLRFIQASMNSSVDETTGLTPHQIVFGFDAALPFENMMMSSLPQQALTTDSIQEYLSHPNETRGDMILNAVKKLDRNREKMTKIWREEWKKSRSATVGPVVRPIYEVGRQVLVYQPPSHKLDAIWVPGIITRHLGKECVEVKFSDGSVQVYHKDHIKDDDSHPSRTQSSIEAEEPIAQRRPAATQQSSAEEVPTHHGRKRLPSTPEPVEFAEPTKRRVLRNPTRTYFVAWKDADGMVRYGQRLSWTNDGYFLVQEYKLDEAEQMLLPLWISSEGSHHIGTISDPECKPLTLTVSPKDTVTLHLDGSSNHLSQRDIEKVASL